MRSDGRLKIHKLLSVNPHRYPDAAVEGIREILGLDSQSPMPETIEQIRLGTTIATNALLERKGEPTVLIVNRGFKDCLRIAYQNRPDIFARHIVLPQPLYSMVLEVPGRLDAQGNEIEAFDETATFETLKQAFDAGIKSCAIVFMHNYLYPIHEERCAEVASRVGFSDITTSHATSPLAKLVIRGDTTVADAYLSPILTRYVDRFLSPFENVSVYFMQSNGGLADGKHFRGKDSLLSGPAGGVVGAVETAGLHGFNKVVSFDMGGTSTDVAHFDNEYERQDLTTISGIRIRAPMIAVHTIAAGGGSILQFDGHKLLVGPESAGSSPGPASYRNGGPLTITDANLLLGRIQPQYFPHIFGEDGKQSLDPLVVADKFLEMKESIDRLHAFERTEDIAWGFIEIAVEKMAQAIKKITIERGYDVKDAVLNSFGGAGGQHALLIAERLGMKTVMIHPMAGVLSALGIGLSSIKVVLHQAVQKEIAEIETSHLEQFFEKLIEESRNKLTSQAAQLSTHEFKRIVMIRYQGSDTCLPIGLADKISMKGQFHDLHLRRFGFHSQDKELIVESITLEASAIPDEHPTARLKYQERDSNEAPPNLVSMYSKNRWWQDTVAIKRELLTPGKTITGPAIILDETSTNIVEPGWQSTMARDGTLIMTTAIGKAESIELSASKTRHTDKETVVADPVLLELFNSKFMAIAEEMGVTLCQTSQSVNIKERLDFSCALFDPEGKLIANAPHMPVHLGSMGESVRAILNFFQGRMHNGDVYVLNNPYKGGTHLPDVTVVTPVFSDSQRDPVFFTASRGHHADIGGITPGSMPPNSQSIEEEGALIDPVLLVSRGEFQEETIRSILINCRYPSRNVEQNLSDLKAQVAANNRGVSNISKMIEDYGLTMVYDYMHFVRKNAEDCVRQAIDRLNDGNFEVEMDNGAKIQVQIRVNKKERSATIDFSGTSPQQTGNLNAPRAITIAAVLYVFRTLVDSNIPLNDGCMAPLSIIIPDGSILSPSFPAAVVAGNVETSQAIVDAVYGALNVMAASQGTMNNFTFGNSRYQYYETVCGGSAAGPDHSGCDAVQTHMTNSRLTDPEVLEWRFPVILKEFSIRKGSGGTGNYNGGNGVIRQMQFRESMQASILSERRRIAPFGMHGGEGGKRGRNYVIRHQNATIEELSGTDTVEMNENDIFVIETPGGGAWGSSEIG